MRFSGPFTGRKFCSKFSESPFVFNIAFWEIITRQITSLDMSWSTQFSSILQKSIYFLVCPTPQFNQTIPTSFFVYKLPQCISWLTQTIPHDPSRVVVLPELFHGLIPSCHTPVCCNCKGLFWHEHVWIWPWMGAPVGNHASRVKLPPLVG